MIKRLKYNNESEVQPHRTSWKTSSHEIYQWNEQNFTCFL